MRHGIRRSHPTRSRLARSRAARPHGARPRAARTAAAVALTALLAGACATDAADDAAPADAPDGFPVTVENCGVRTTYEAPPERVVTIHQHPAELLLALGLGERMVGTAFPDSAVLPAYREEFAEIPELSPGEPSFESVLEVEPEFVYGGYASAFAEREGRSREAFADAGIATHLNPEYCGDGEVTMDLLYQEIRTLGTVFDVPERAEELVDELAARVAETTEAVAGAEPPSVFVYDSGEDAAFTAGGAGLGQEIIELAGGENVFDDLDEIFGDVSWEQVAERDPDVVVIYDYEDEAGGSVERKRDFLLSHPALADVPAIREERIAVLPLTSTVLGVRPPDAVAELARELHPERFR